MACIWAVSYTHLVMIIGVILFVILECLVISGMTENTDEDCRYVIVLAAYQKLVLAGEIGRINLLNVCEIDCRVIKRRGKMCIRDRYKKR